MLDYMRSIGPRTIFSVFGRVLTVRLITFALSKRDLKEFVEVLVFSETTHFQENLCLGRFWSHSNVVGFSSSHFFQRYPMEGENESKQKKIAYKIGSENNRAWTSTVLHDCSIMCCAPMNVHDSPWTSNPCVEKKIEQLIHVSCSLNVQDSPLFFNSKNRACLSVHLSPCVVLSLSTEKEDYACSSMEV